MAPYLNGYGLGSASESSNSNGTPENGFSSGPTTVNGTPTTPNGLDELSVSPAVDKTTPIAIVGMSCRFPGDATNPERLWQMCAEGREAWTPIPKERWNQQAFHHPDPVRRTVNNPTLGS